MIVKDDDHAKKLVVSFEGETMERFRGVFRVFSALTAFSLMLSTQVGIASEQRVLVKFKDPQLFRSLVQIQNSQNNKNTLSAVNTVEMQARRMQMVFPQVSMRYENSLKNVQSVVVNLKSTADLEKLRANPNVAFVDVEVFHPAPKPMLGAIYSPVMDGGSPFVPSKGTPWGILTVKAIDAWKIGNRGANARVMVLDTGIDKDHPSIKNNFEEGKSFVVNQINNENNFSDSIGHGTHVSATIAGVLDASGFTGVAPEAKILMSKVCAEGGCSNIAIAKAIDWAIQKKVDIISMSLGGQWSTPSERDAISHAYKAGITLVAATGNDGVSQVSYPAALSEVIAVGATDINNQRAQFSQYGPELAIMGPGVNVVSAVPMGSGRTSKVMMSLGDNQMTEVISAPFQGTGTTTQAMEREVVYVGLGRVQDFGSVNVEGKFALIQRGEIKFGEKAMNAFRAKAAGVIIFNNAPGLSRGTLTEDGSQLSIPVFGIEQSIGENVRDALSRGGVVKSRVIMEATNYAAFDGTSMATPHVSGVIALMKSVNKSLTPAQVKAIIQKTAVKVDSNPNNQYGAGIVNALEAVKEAKATTTIDNSVLHAKKSKEVLLDLAM